MSRKYGWYGNRMDSYENNILEFRSQLDGEGLTAHDLRALRGFSPDGVVILGMGGSGMAGMLFEATASSLGVRVPVMVVENAALPPLFFKHPLFISVSFSGVTPETIATTRAALRIKRGRLAIVTTGGPLRRLGETKKLPRVTFEAGDLTPRGSHAYMYYAILEIVKKVLPIRVPTISRSFSPSGLRAQGKEHAKKLRGAPALVYVSSPDAHLGYAWKRNLNETGKIPAFTHHYPELYHEEIAGFEKTKVHWNAIWIVNLRLGEEEKKKIKRTQSILQSHGVKSFFVPLRGNNALEEMWNSDVLSHWVSYYLAKAEGLDPKAIPIITKLKSLKK